MDQYRVFGNPIAQSKSPLIHQEFAKQTTQKLHYESELATVETFEEAVRQLIANNGKGANVTAPFKELAYQMCDQLSERAELAGAVNTLIFENGSIIGDTTDGLGLVNDLLRHNIDLMDKHILLLGAGGAAKGVVKALLDQTPANLTIANRTVSKAQAIVDQYSLSNLQACSFEQTQDKRFDVIINATSAGLSDQTLPINAQTIAASIACYDMVYGKTPTPFLQMAASQGVKHVIDGLGMLVGQAAESFKMWRNVSPEVEPVLNMLRAELN